MAAQTLPSTQADQQSSRGRIDERHYRKMGAFSGMNWKDWSFQSRSTTKSSSMDAYKQALRVGGTRNHRDRGQSCPLLAVLSTQETFFVSTSPDENTDRKRTMDLFLLSLHLSTRPFRLPETTSKTPEGRSATLRVGLLFFFSFILVYFSFFLTSIAARFLVTFLTTKIFF